MQSIKIGWHGAFAMVKNNENEGKKSRNRISKEERKKLTVSFIKKYQTLNGGSFPSLNLTQKEVGGSFYTTRDIVREIIQENKILGSVDLFHIDNQDSVEMPSRNILEFDCGKPSNGEVASKDEDSSSNDEVHTVNNVSSIYIPNQMELAGSEIIVFSEGSDEKVVLTPHEIENGSLKFITSEMSSSTIFSEYSNPKVVSALHKFETLQIDVGENGLQNDVTSESLISLDSLSSELSFSPNVSKDSNAKVVEASYKIENLPVKDEDDCSQNVTTSVIVPSLEIISLELSSSTLQGSDTKLVSTSHEIEDLQKERSQTNPISENMPASDAISSETTSSVIVEKESSQKEFSLNKAPSLGTIPLVGSSSSEDLTVSSSLSEEPSNIGKQTEINGESDKGKLDRIHISKTWEGPSRQEVPPILAAFRSFLDSIRKYFTT